MNTPSPIDLRGLPAKLAAAITRAQGRQEYDSLEQFATDFNPLAEELMTGEHIPMDSPSWYAFQQLCIRLFEYGDAKWPHQVNEYGVSI